MQPFQMTDPQICVDHTAMLGERFNQLHQSHRSKHRRSRANQQNKDLSTHSFTSHEMQEHSSLAVLQHQHVLNFCQERDDVLQQQ